MTEDSNHEGRLAPLAEHIEHDPSGARFERQWLLISERLGAGRPWWRSLLVPLVAALLAISVVGLGALWWRGSAVRSWEGVALESDGSGQVMRLPDGAEVQLARSTLVRVTRWSDASVVLALDHGEVTVDVPHRAGRTWIVAAGVFDV